MEERKRNARIHSAIQAQFVKFAGVVALAILLTAFFVLPSCRSTASASSIVRESSYTPLSSAYVSVLSFGYDANDSTRFLQAAFDSSVETILIPAGPGPWVAGPLQLPSNKTIIFEEGASLEAKPGEFIGRGDAFLNGIGIENLVIIGYGANITMRKKDYQRQPYEESEWRHAINLRAAKHIHIHGLSISSSGGDGIYIGSQWSEDVPGCQDIELSDLQISDNRRQGISVTSVDGLTIEFCEISSTRGTAPSAGIDFEPNRSVEILHDIVVRNCDIHSNAGQGILIQLQKLTAESQAIDIDIRNCRLWNNFFNISLLGTRHSPRGAVTIEGTESGRFNIFIPGKCIELMRQ